MRQPTARFFFLKCTPKVIERVDAEKLRHGLNDEAYFIDCRVVRWREREKNVYCKLGPLRLLVD